LANITDFKSLDPQAFLERIAKLRSDDPARALAELDHAPGRLAEDAEVRLTRADLNWEVHGPEVALPLLEKLVEDIADYADARHMLGCVYEETGREADKVQQFSEVLRLDQTCDPAINSEEYAELEDLIVEAAENGLDRLPLEWRTRLSGVPILVEGRPSEDLVEQGFDPRALGLFEGPTHADETNAEIAGFPTRIVLFASNLLEQTVDEEQLRSEVETTVLHEVGHYFGLDEDDLERMGLD
jgi:predicted Zn-dependent protease with MMP-like domain